MRLALLPAVALLCALPARAATKYPPFPAQGCVYDAAHLLSAAQVTAITDTACGPLNRAGVAVLWVATIPNLGDETREEYATGLFEAWKIGHGKARSDGLLMLAAPSSKHPWGLQMEVGLGLQGVLPDGKVGALLDQFWIPAVERGAPGEGIVATARAVAGLLSADAKAGGDAAPTEASRRAGQRGGAPAEINGSALALAILAMVGLLIALATSAARRAFPGKKTGYAALGVSVVVAIALASMANALGGWIALLIGLFVNGLVYASIRSHKCPKDGSWMTIREEVIDPPTYFSDGVAQVWEHCTNKKCGYERTYEKRLPRKTVTVSSGGGGSSGGDSPGGGYESDSYGGGGGESDGGGAGRD
jgi:uncharacterized protein